MRMITRLSVSPKVWRPVAVLIVAALVNWIASGEIDRTEIAGLVGAVLTAVVGYWSPPGDVVVDAPSSDELNAEAFAEHLEP